MPTTKKKPAPKPKKEKPAPKPKKEKPLKIWYKATRMPEGYRLASMKEAIENNKVNLYGKLKIDTKLISLLEKEEFNKLTSTELINNISKLGIKARKLAKEIKEEKNTAIREEKVIEYKKLVKEYNENTKRLEKIRNNTDTKKEPRKKQKKEKEEEEEEEKEEEEEEEEEVEVNDKVKQIQIIAKIRQLNKELHNLDLDYKNIWIEEEEKNKILDKIKILQKEKSKLADELKKINLLS
jgi:hypothetical protein